MVCEEIYRYSTAPPGGHQPELNLQVVEEIPGSRRRSQERCHEGLHNRKSADVYFGLEKEAKDRWEEIKRKALEKRRRDPARQDWVAQAPGQMGAEKTLLVEPELCPKCSDDVQSD